MLVIRNHERRDLFAAVRAMPHMAITKHDGEYRITYRLASIAAADQGRHSTDWHRDHAERSAYYTTDRDDAHGTARTLSAIARRPAAFPRVLATSAEKGTGIPELRAEIAAACDVTTL